MKEKKLFNAITNINEKFVDEAKNEKVEKKKPHYLRRGISIAAAIAVISTGFAIYPLLRRNTTAFSRPDTKTSSFDVTYPQSIAFENQEAKAANIEANPVSNSTIKAVNSFGYSSAAKIFSKGKNANYSPISLYFSLALAESGAGGTTKDEFLKVLGVSSFALSKECGNLYRTLYFDNEIGKLKIANSLWINNGFNLKNSFKENAVANFYASSHNVDFTSSSTKELISNWIANNTENSIVPEINVDKDTLLSIINTVYFNDQWEYQFDENKTKSDDFNLSDDRVAQCSFLCGEQLSSFASGNNFTRASLMFKNGGKMVFVLPNEGVSLDKLLSDSDSIKNAFESGEGSLSNVTWQIPKFSFSSDYELIDSLKSLGVKSAFADSADFSSMTDSSVLISRIHQESFIKLNEDGVEAAAFTQTDFKETVAISNTTSEMILDRPFLYGIYSENGTLLFIGVCENPNGLK